MIEACVLRLALGALRCDTRLMLKRFAPLAAVTALALPAAAQAHVTPLSWSVAHAKAKAAAMTLPVPGTGAQRASIYGCNQFGHYEIDCVVNAFGTYTTTTPDDCKTIDGDGNCVPGTDTSTDQSECVATIDVKKSKRTGRITVRRESNLSCTQ